MLDSIPVAAIEAAHERIRGSAVHTPLVPFRVDDAPAEIYLKLENLQPIGSFKLRGAGNAVACAGDDALAAGVVTASAGNMAQGLAWHARRLGIPCHTVVPDHAPQAKLDAIEALGGQITAVPFERWWQVIVEHHYPGLEGGFIHPVCNPDVIAGNGTIGIEILADLPDVDTVVVPYGGGGLSTGIASLLRARKPGTRVLACEVETAAPLTAALAAGAPVEVPYTPSFVDGMGSKRVLDEMWPLVSSVLDDSAVVGLQEIEAAIRTLVDRNKVIAEGAGAASVAAAVSGRAGTGKIVCVVSGGNIDVDVLARILGDDLPG